MVRLLTAALMLAVSPALAANDAASIRSMMSGAFDRGEVRVVVDPLVVDGDVALAGWTQEDRGGRALIRRRGAVWSVHLCGGDGLAEAAALNSAGVPADQASRLAARLLEAEQSVDPKRRALFSTFGGIVSMDKRLDAERR